MDMETEKAIRLYREIEADIKKDIIARVPVAKADNVLKFNAVGTESVSEGTLTINWSLTLNGEEIADKEVISREDVDVAMLYGVHSAVNLFEKTIDNVSHSVRDKLRKMIGESFVSFVSGKR